MDVLGKIAWRRGIRESLRFIDVSGGPVACLSREIQARTSVSFDTSGGAQGCCEEL
jgi:hypothetical protein